MTTSDASYARQVLHEIATQAYSLAMGLQNAAPFQTGPAKSVQYLLEISLQIDKTSKQIEEVLLIQASRKKGLTDSLKNTRS